MTSVIAGLSSVEASRPLATDGVEEGPGDLGITLAQLPVVLVTLVAGSTNTHGDDLRLRYEVGDRARRRLDPRGPPDHQPPPA